MHPTAPDCADLPRLTDGVVLLRPHRDDDAQALFEAALESLSTVGRWLPWCHEGYTLEEARSWIAASQRHWREEAEYALGIFEAGSGTLLGGTGINQVNRVHRIGNVGYWIRRSRMGEGLVPRALRLLMPFGLGRCKLARLEILTEIDNVRSQRVAEKVGARLEGVLRDRLFLHGSSRPARLYSFVREDVQRLENSRAP